jgi:hypothetical protein
MRQANKMNGMPRIKGSTLFRLLIIGGNNIGTKHTIKKIINPNLLFSLLERFLVIIAPFPVFFVPPAYFFLKNLPPLYSF